MAPLGARGPARAAAPPGKTLWLPRRFDGMVRLERPATQTHFARHPLTDRHPTERPCAAQRQASTSPGAWEYAHLEALRFIRDASSYEDPERLEQHFVQVLSEFGFDRYAC